MVPIARILVVGVDVIVGCSCPEPEPGMFFISFPPL